jgi:hypothetical protein
VLASFAAIMRDQVDDGLVNVVGALPDALTLYCEVLEAIGASWLATDIRALAVSDLDSDDSQTKMMKLNNQMEANWGALWSAGRTMRGNMDGVKRLLDGLGTALAIPKGGKSRDSQPATNAAVAAAVEIGENSW